MKHALLFIFITSLSFFTLFGETFNMKANKIHSGCSIQNKANIVKHGYDM